MTTCDATNILFLDGNLPDISNTKSLRLSFERETGRFWPAIDDTIHSVHMTLRYGTFYIYLLRLFIRHLRLLLVGRRWLWAFHYATPERHTSLSPLTGCPLKGDG